MYPEVNTIKRVGETSNVRIALLALAGLRAVLSLVAIPLAPALYRDHFLALVLLRPTKEVLLAGGFLVRRGDVNLGALLLAAIPLLLLGVWHMFWLGRSYSEEVRNGEGLPSWAERVLPPKRIKQMRELLDKKGPRVIVAGRVAAFPSSLMGAAAGASDIEPKRFMAADALGAALSLAEVVIAGFVLGEAYKEAGPIVTAVGVVVLIGILVYVGRSLKRT